MKGCWIILPSGYTTFDPDMDDDLGYTEIMNPVTEKMVRFRSLHIVVPWGPDALTGTVYVPDGWQHKNKLNVMLLGWFMNQMHQQDPDVVTKQPMPPSMGDPSNN